MLSPVRNARLYQAVRRQGLRLFSCSTGCSHRFMQTRTRKTGRRRSRRCNLVGIRLLIDRPIDLTSHLPAEETYNAPKIDVVHRTRDSHQSLDELVGLFSAQVWQFVLISYALHANTISLAFHILRLFVCHVTK